MTGTRRAGAALALLASLASSLSLSGCGGGRAVCSAIGYTNSLSVKIDNADAATRVGSVVLGFPGSEPYAGQSGRPVLAGQPGQSGQSGHVIADGSGPMARGQGGTWISGPLMSTPNVVSLQVFDSSGALVAESDVRPEWIRVGGTEQCGGPHEATVEIHVP